MCNQVKGRRYNKGKLRYELISNVALEEIAKVYTVGAEKYTIYDDSGNIISDGSDNWRNGLYWMDCIASAKRHIEKFIKNVDIDEETKTLHLANACWNLMTIIDFYKSFPQGDDRPKRFLKQPRIGLDIDGVLANFIGAWNKKYSEISALPNSWYADRKIKTRFDEMRNNGELDDFYLNIETLIKSEDLPFEPHCYITSRPVSKEITEQWLDKHNFPAKPVYSIDVRLSKVDVAKQAQVEIFIDDSYENFVDLNNNGIFTYLFTAPWNIKYDVGHMRLNSLKNISLFE
jgi:uncharacterized HAD superfamily protein